MLTLRALRLAQYYWSNLIKRVPHGAGLGGGSGNAATALWAANELSGRPVRWAQPCASGAAPQGTCAPLRRLVHIEWVLQKADSTVAAILAPARCLDFS